MGFIIVCNSKEDGRKEEKDEIKRKRASENVSVSMCMTDVNLGLMNFRVRADKRMILICLVRVDNIIMSLCVTV